MMPASMTVYAVGLAHPLEAAVWESLLSRLPETKRGRLRRFARREDAERSLLAEVLARSLIGEFLELPDREIHFAANRFGKPYLPAAPGFHFNLSHSGSWVACALGRAPLGVDVERVRPFDMDLAERFFTPRENAFLRSAPAGERHLRFFELWTLKESFLKAVGCGLSMPLNSFSVLPEGKDFRLHAEGYPGYSVHRLPFDPEYRLSVCSSEGASPGEVVYLAATTLCENFLAASRSEACSAPAGMRFHRNRI